MPGLAQVQPGWCSKTMSQKLKRGRGGWRGQELDCSLMIEHLPSMPEALGSIPRNVTYRMFSVVFGNMSMLQF